MAKSLAAIVVIHHFVKYGDIKCCNISSFNSKGYLFTSLFH